jgi:hypothetical protein
MIMRRPQHKQFEYIPRYYDPSKDEEARKRRRIKFERHTSRGAHRPLLFIIVALVLVYLIYSYLN